MIGQTVWIEFFGNRDWPVASALAIVMLLILLVPIVLYQRLQARELEAEGADGRLPPSADGRGPLMRRGLSPFNLTALVLGFAFLYLPIVILVIYSFNASRLVTVWGGWSLRWYVSLFQDGAILAAAWISLRVAAVSATLATVLGTLAAVALVRAGRFRGPLRRSPGMVYAPLVMPEIITGLALLLLFVAIGIDRGFWTVTLAHTTLTMCFVAVVVQSRLIELRPQPGRGGDGPGLPAVRRHS